MLKDRVSKYFVIFSLLSSGYFLQSTNRMSSPEIIEIVESFPENEKREREVLEVIDVSPEELKEKNNDLGLEYFNKLDRLAKLREKISIRWMEFAKRKIDSKLNILEDLHRHMFDIYKNSMEFLRNIYNKADDNVKKELTSLLKNSFEKSKKVYKDMHHRFEEREKKLHQEYEKIKKETERELERII